MTEFKRITFSARVAFTTDQQGRWFNDQGETLSSKEARTWENKYQDKRTKITRLIQEVRTKKTIPDINLAFRIAAEAHFYQVDKCQRGAMDHILAVAGTMQHRYPAETDLICAAVLHDVPEDTLWSLMDLGKIGFSKEIIDIVESVTKRISRTGEEELYFDFIERCSFHSKGRRLKLIDLEHNKNRDLHLPTERDYLRNKKYILAIAYLRDVEQGRIKPGTPITTWMAQQPPNLQDWRILQGKTSHAIPQKYLPRLNAA